MYISVNCFEALDLGDIFIVQPMASEVFATTCPHVFSV